MWLVTTVKNSIALMYDHHNEWLICGCGQRLLGKSSIWGHRVLEFHLQEPEITDDHDRNRGERRDLRQLKNGKNKWGEMS